MARGNGKSATHDIVTDVLTSGMPLDRVARKHKVSVGKVRKTCQQFAETVLKPPSLGEIALSNPNMFVNAQMPAYNPSVLVTRKGLKVFDEMRKDDQIKAALTFKKLAAIASGWEIISPEQEDEEHEPTQFIKYSLENTDVDFSDRVLEVLTALDFGYSVSEMIFKEIDRGEFSGKIGLHDVKTKSPHDMGFKIDDFGNIQNDGIVQYTRNGVKNYPRDKFLVFTFQGEFSNPYGKSDLEACYPRWWPKENAYRWLAMLLERFGVPPIFALYDPSTYDEPQVSALRLILERLQAATSGAIPRAGKDSLELWAPELADQTARVFIPALNLYDRAIARALLMPNLLGVSPETGPGSFARSQTEFDVFMFAVNHLRIQLASSINKQVIRPLVRFNYGEQDSYPIFRFLPISDDMQLELFKTWGALVQLQVVKPQLEDESHIRQRFGFPKLEERPEEDEPEPEPEPEPGPDDEDPEDGNGEDGPKDEIIDEPETGTDNEFEDRFAHDHAGHPHHYRALTPHEKRVDFKQIKRDLDGFEAEMVKALVPQLRDVRDRFLKFVKDKFDYDARFIRDMKPLRGLGSTYDEIELFLRKAYNAGSKAVATELEIKQEAKIKTADEQAEAHSYIVVKTPDKQEWCVKSEETGRGFGCYPSKKEAEDRLAQIERIKHVKDNVEAPNFRPRDAERYLKAKTFWITDVIDERIRGKSRGVLLNAIKKGEHITKTIEKLKGVFEPYVGNDKVLRDGEPIKPAHLETIIRTNLTDAFNQGRMVEGRRAGPLLVGFQYSAVIDSVTTPVCQFLDEKYFRPDDPHLDELSPPRHMNCRSILVPISIDTELDESDFIDDRQAARAQELSGEGFSSDDAWRGYGFDPDQPRDEDGKWAGGAGGGGGGGSRESGTGSRVVEDLQTINSVPMLHMTSPSNATAIRSGGFKLSTNSMYGPGVYFSDKQAYGGSGKEVISVSLLKHKQLVIDHDTDVGRISQKLVGKDQFSSGWREAMIGAGYKSLRFPVDDQTYTVVLDPAIIKLGGFTSDDARRGYAEKARSLYINRRLMNPEPFIEWAKSQGFTSVIKPDDIHVTIAFSKTPVVWGKMGDHFDMLKVGSNLGKRSVEPLGVEGAVVLKFEAPELTKRWQDLKDNGASWDFPDFHPHLTISYDAGGMDLSKVKPYQGEIILGPERFEELDEGWKDKVKEE